MRLRHSGGTIVAPWDGTQPVLDTAPAPARWAKRYPPLILTLLLTIWLWRHPWDGIWHDNTVYAAQALRWLQPDVFGRDLFFLYGSQANYTLFVPCFAATVSALGLYGATLTLLVCSYAAWIVAAGLLLRCFLQGRYFWLGMVCLFSLPSDYGPVPGVFQLAEPFLTPRAFAEASSMLALSSILRRQVRVAVLAVLLACVLHPLMGLASLASLLFYMGLSHPWRVAAVLAAGAAATVAAAWMGVAPFDRLLQHMDDVWYARVVDAAPMLSWNTWRSSEWISRTVLAFGLVLTGALLAKNGLRRMLCCITLTGVVGLMATWLGTGIYHNLIIIQLQPWRALWLVQLAALFVLPWLVANYWRRSAVFRLLLLILFLAYLVRDNIGGVIGVLACVALWGSLRQVQPRSLPTLFSSLVAVAVLMVVVVAWRATLEHTVLRWTAITTAPISPHQHLFLMGLALLKTGGGAAMALALFCMLVACGRFRSKPAHLIVFGILFTSFLLAAATFDHQRMSSTYRDPATIDEIRSRFQPLIAPSAIVYWEDDIQSTWFVLQRASYASFTQLVGLVFNRGTAIEGTRRLERLRALGVPDSIVGMDPQLRRERINRLPKAGFEGLVHVCHDPLLAFVVHTKLFPDGVIQKATDQRHQQVFYLYDCKLLRGRYADPQK